jgi:DNA-binding Lrp family transcriptional regulator
MRSNKLASSDIDVELDDTDHRLIGELMADGRATYAALADHVDLSAAAARARVLRLLDEQVITVSARIDPRTAGAAVFELTFISVDAPAEQVAEAISSVEEAVFVVCITGPWGLLAEIRCRDKDHQVETLDRVRAAPGVVEVESLTVIEYFKQDWSGLAAELVHHRSEGRRQTPVPSPRRLDDLDRRIIVELIADGRVTFAELAPIVGLSSAAVRARVHRLLDEGTVVVQTHPAPDILGPGIFAAALLTTRRGAADLAKRLSKIVESTLVVVTSGRYQVACELWARDGHHLLVTLDRIRGLDEVASVDCYPYLSIEKEIYQVTGLVADESR